MQWQVSSTSHNATEAACFAAKRVLVSCSSYQPNFSDMLSVCCSCRAHGVVRSACAPHENGGGRHPRRGATVHRRKTKDLIKVHSISSPTTEMKCRSTPPRGHVFYGTPSGVSDVDCHDPRAHEFARSPKYAIGLEGSTKYRTTCSVCLAWYPRRRHSLTPTNDQLANYARCQVAGHVCKQTSMAFANGTCRSLGAAPARVLFASTTF